MLLTASRVHVAAERRQGAAAASEQSASAPWRCDCPRLAPVRAQRPRSHRKVCERRAVRLMVQVRMPDQAPAVDRVFKPSCRHIAEDIEVPDTGMQDLSEGLLHIALSSSETAQHYRLTDALLHQDTVAFDTRGLPDRGSGACRWPISAAGHPHSTAAPRCAWQLARQVVQGD